MSVDDTTTSTPRFEQVSRLKGRVFEALSFGASVVGLFALAILLVYVVIDAFNLTAASPEWLLSYYVTLVLPFIAFCLYSANDAIVTRRVLMALGGGLIVVAGLFTAIETLLRPIPRLTWPLAYLFIVVAPVTGYITYVGGHTPVGRAGLGLVGRLLGGIGIGLALFVLFRVLDPRLWFLAYTLGLFPAAVLALYARQDASGWASSAVLPVAILGMLAAVFLRSLINIYPTQWLLYIWSLVVPMSGLVAFMRMQSTTRRDGLVTGGAVFMIAAGGSALAGAVGINQSIALLVLLMVAVPSVTYTRRMITTSNRVGLLLPVLLLAGILLGSLLVETFGFPAPDSWLNLSYLTNSPSRFPEEAGLYPAIVGSVLVIAIVAMLSLALGVGTAVFLEEYTAGQGFIGTLTRILQINIANLAAVPSVVYGLLGLGVFVNLLNFGLGTIITAGVTLALLILPITIISAQEAIRSVPDDLRQASYAMGATRWQTTRNVVLPEAFPGILTGTILALGRAIGETAPLIMIGAPTTSFSAPDSLLSSASAMPMQIYAWADFPQPEFRYGVLAAGVVTLLIVLIGMNGTAILLRNRAE